MEKKKKITKPPKKIIKKIKTNTLTKKEVNIIENPILRKKICVKMAKILQDKYLYDKEKAQNMTLKLELKIRNENPDMKKEYRNKVFVILKLIKVTILLYSIF